MMTTTFVSRGQRAQHISMIMQITRNKLADYRSQLAVTNTNSRHYATLRRLITANEARLEVLAQQGERWFSRR
jgi:hypothetical protein